jgi:hypothetical protein
MARLERGVQTFDLLGSGDTTTIALISSASIYTQSFKTGDGESYALSVKLASTAATAVSTTFSLEQSWAPPTTEYATDTNYVTTLSQSATLVSLGTTGTWFRYALTVNPLEYARVKILTGALMSVSNVTVQVKLHKQVEG